MRWKGRIAAGTTSDRVTGFEDWLPTLLELIGERQSTPKSIDGISFAPTLLGREQDPRPFLYRESPGGGGQQSVRIGNWKGIRVGLNPAPKEKFAPEPLQLYDLTTDPAETTDVAAKHPEVVEKMTRILREQHVKSEEFPIRALDGS